MFEPTNYAEAGFFAFFAAYAIIFVPLLLISLIAAWRIFSKAGRPGWAILIPFYNIYVYTQVLQRPKWWILLYFAGLIPIVGVFASLFVTIIDALRLAKLFGKSTGFGIGLILLGFIFYPILGLGSARYRPDAVEADALV